MADNQTTVVVISAGPDIPTAEALARLAVELATKQQPLGADFTKVLYDNLWDLYVRS